jgi:hypothetical protein
MPTPQTSPEGRFEFEELCEDIDEFEPLPDHGTTVLGEEAWAAEDEPAQLDELILAGLVSPV